jgi:hypothetical protein
MQLCIWTNLALIFLFPATKPEANNYFEGKVVYKHSIIIKNKKVDSVALKEFVGSGSTLYFKEGNYLHTYDGGFFVRDIYRKDDNKGYFKTGPNDTSYWIDCGKRGDQIIKFAFTPKKEKILGIDCDELVIYYNDNIVTDYYNPDSLRINPDWFKNFKLDGQDQIDQKEKSIVLKHKTEYADFIIIKTAISYTREEVDGTIFKLSPGEILIERE